MPDYSVEDFIRREAKAAGVPEELALAVAEQESGFNPTVQGPEITVGGQKTRALGTFQLLPTTAQMLQVDPQDPVQNIRGGVKYLRQLLDRHEGNLDRVLAEYGGVKTDTKYVPGVLGRMPKFRTITQPVPTLPAVTLQDEIRSVGSRPGARVVATPPPGPSVFQPSLTESVLSSVDPRTRTGRRNLAGGIGAAAATGALVATAPVSAPVLGATAVVGSALGAAGGGMLAEAGEQLVGTAPPSTAGVLAAGGEQAAYDVAGHAMIWPLRAGARRFAASRVGRFAGGHFDRALTGARDAVTYARETARGAVEGARQHTEEAVRIVREAAGQHVERAKGMAESATRGVRERFDRVATAPSSVTPRVAGQRAHAVAEGPAKDARHEIGQLVDQAAESGPDVDITALKAEAQRILSEEIRPPQQAFPRTGGDADPALEELRQLASSTALSPEAVAKLPPSGQAQAQAIHEALAAAQQEQAAVILKHPAMQVLGRILSAEDTVPFKSAHLFKRELDEAVGNAWEMSVKSRVTNITKTLRGTLRESLRGHAPYDEATRAYQAIAPLYTKGLAPRLRKAAIDAPEALIRMIKPNDPTKLSMLRELLVTQPGRVGREAEGQQAWDSVRAMWTQENLINGGLEKLDAQIGKMDPEFLQIMYGDGPGSRVLENLRSISAAFNQAEALGTATVAEAKQVAKGSVDWAQQQAQANVREATRRGRALVGQRIQDLGAVKAEAKQFVKSSLIRAKDEDLISDALRAGGLGVGSIWGAQSIARLMLRGPKAKDLIAYAAYSPEGTQLLVRALTGPEPGVAMANLLRLSGIGSFVREAVATPPTAPQGRELVGAPPP